MTYLSSVGHYQQTNHGIVCLYDRRTVHSLSLLFQILHTSVTSHVKSLLSILHRRTALYSQPSIVSLFRAAVTILVHPRASIPYALCSFSKLSVTSPTSQLILQPFPRFTYVTTYSPTLPLLHLRHSSFSNPSFASPTLKDFHLRHQSSCPC